MAVADNDYNSTLALTDVFDSNTVLHSAGAISQTGMFQRDLVSFLSSYITNFNALLAKLDADGGVTDTNYVSTVGLSNLTTVYKVTNAGVFQEDLVDLLVAVHTKFVALTAKLDADAGVAAVTYARDCDFTVINRLLVAAGGVIDQGKIVDYLKIVVTKLNLLLDELDADTSPSSSPSSSPSGV